MTDNEIIKALENEIHLVKYIDGYSACHDDTGGMCDYESKTDSCKFNPHCADATDTKKET